MFALIVEYSNDCKSMDFDTFADALWEARRIAECHPGVWSVWITDTEAWGETEVWGEILFEQTGSIPALAS